MKLKIKKILLGLLIVLLLWAIWYFLIPKHNVFVRTGNMNIARWGAYHSVLLKDGQVFILAGAKGGQGGGVEIYNPKTKKFKLIDHPPILTSVTLLNNGSILLAALQGGVIFDPTLDTFRDVGKMHCPRKHHTATLLNDGRVLIVGGQQLSNTWIYCEYSEIYNPDTEKFELGPKIITPRFYHAAILLDDGDVLFVGGNAYEQKENSRSRSAELYDYKLNKFVKLPEMNYIRVKPVLTKLKDGKILIASGYGDFEKQKSGNRESHYQKMTEIYNPKTKKFEKFVVNNISSPRGFPITLNDGRVLFIPAAIPYRWYGKATKSTAILNPDTREIIQGPDTKRKRGDGTIPILLEDGTVLITGGDEKPTAEIYIP